MDVQAIDQSHAAAKAKPASEALPAFDLPAFGKGLPSGIKPEETLSKALSTLAGGGANVSVSVQVLEHPDQIGTVFKNADTGGVSAQVPAQTVGRPAQGVSDLGSGHLGLRARVG